MNEAALASIDAVAWTPASAFPSVLARADSSFFSLKNPPDAHLVAEVTGKVAGYVLVKPVTSVRENAHVLGITGLAVAPDARDRESPAPCLPPSKSTHVAAVHVS